MTIGVVIPCRNEKGNIEAALQRLPSFPGPVEVIYVEGHSSDGTWEEVQRVTGEYAASLAVSAYRQTGKGKSDAYIADWKRGEPRDCGDDLKAEAMAEAARLEARYTDADLERLRTGAPDGRTVGS